ncbi:MAG: C-terminal binding protein [Dehalococcoidia bacterium]|nr:C-terminal binding protein [Dehalococcoidia bacterium]
MGSVTVLHLDAGPDQSLDEELAQLAPLDVNLVRGRLLSPEERERRLREADAVLVAMTQVDYDAINCLEKCKVIVRYGVGVDNIDLAAATERGIVVAYLPGYCTEEVANHALALLLASARSILALDSHVKGGGWTRRGETPRPLYGETLGIIGFGRIGRALARRALALDMLVVAHDPYVSREVVAEHGATKTDLDSLLRESDYVSLNASLTPETRGLIGRRELALMKESAFLINTARGPEVDETALVEALRDRRIAGAALDVFEEEPLPADSPLRSLDNVVLTPHMAFFSRRSMARARREVGLAAAAVLNGRWPKWVANPEVAEKLSLLPNDEQ